MAHWTHLPASFGEDLQVLRQLRVAGSTVPQTACAPVLAADRCRPAGFTQAPSCESGYTNTPSTCLQLAELPRSLAGCGWRCILDRLPVSGLMCLCGTCGLAWVVILSLPQIMVLLSRWQIV